MAGRLCERSARRSATGVTSALRCAAWQRSPTTSATPSERSRLTNAFRDHPRHPARHRRHVWGDLAEILAFIQWFIVLFTGQAQPGPVGPAVGVARLRRAGQRLRRPAVRPVPGVRHRVGDGADRSSDLAYEEPASRLTNGLRFIWAIPARDHRLRPRHRLRRRRAHLVVRHRDHRQASRAGCSTSASRCSATSCRSTATCC